MTADVSEPATVTLGALATVVGGRVHGQADVLLADITHDSREAAPGVLFACRRGTHADGHDFAPAAVSGGSPALLCERLLDLAVPQLVVPSVAAVLGRAAATIHRDPSAALTVCGITGTNGKTTTTHLLASILRTAGHRTGLLGTLAGVRTTPEATDLQRRFARMRDDGVTAVAMEVSSHGLALGRVSGTHFAVAVFTNLTRDHLDFHADLEAYFRAKASLFVPAFTRVGVVNVDDPYGARIAATADVPILRVSASGGAADVAVTRMEPGVDGSRAQVRVRGRIIDLHVRLPGAFNVANAVCALAAAHAVGVAPDTAAAGIAALAGVPGRMERVDAGQPFGVLVDYAHTPDSLDNVLRAARELARGHVIVVVGCGGGRDPGKRPVMGRVAVALADRAVFTSDNPRGEDPQDILDAMVAGAAGVAEATWTVEPDRRAAIGLALAAATPGDVVVIAGKGHETYQELADRTVDFDDRAVAREWLEGRGQAGADAGAAGRGPGR